MNKKHIEKGIGWIKANWVKEKVNEINAGTKETEEIIEQREEITPRTWESKKQKQTPQIPKTISSKREKILLSL